MKIKFTNLQKLIPNKKKIFRKIENNINENKLIGGSILEHFNKTFKNFIKTKYVVPVANGTDALNSN